MAAKATSKRVPVNCFICNDRQRHFNVLNYQEGNFISKLSFLTGENVQKVAEGLNLGICRPCVTKVDKFFDFANILKKAVCDVESKIEGDRKSVSPVTPKSVPVKKKVKRLSGLCSSKKLLNLATPRVQTTITELDNTCNSDSPVSLSNEHSYSVPIKVEVELSYAQSELLNEPGDSNTNSQNEPTSSRKDRPSGLEVMSLDKLNVEKYTNTVIEEIVDQIVSNQVILHAVQSRLVKDMDAQLSTLVSRHAAVRSVLSRYRSIGSLLKNGSKLINEIVLEMSERIPFLLDIFTVMVTTGSEPVESKVAPVAAAYAILMNARSDHLSAWHRMTTVIAFKGHLNDSALTRFNHLGITQSVSNKLRLLEEAGQRVDMEIATNLAQNPVLKTRGDNQHMDRPDAALAAKTVAKICHNVDLAISVKKQPKIGKNREQ